MNIKILAFVLIIVAMLASPAMAVVELTDDTDTSFSYDYTQLDDDNDDTVTVSFEVELENTGNDTETVTLVVSSSESEYNVDFATSSDSSFDLAAGATKTVTLDVIVDVSDGLFDQNTYEDVIDLEIYTSSGDFDTISFDATVLPMFEVIETFFYIDDDEEGNMNEDDSNDDGVDVDVKPGDEVTIYFNIENLYNKDFKKGDLDFTITAELDDSDFGDDIDEDVDFTIDAGKDVDENDEDVSITFEVPIDAEDGDSYELLLTFEAEDEERVEYSIEWIANINVEREDEDVRLDSLSVYPEVVECGESFGLTIEVVNYGGDKQRDMFLAVDSDDLGIDDDVSFDLGYGYDSDNDEKISFQFFVDDDQAEGEYDITVRSYYNDGDDLADSDQISIDVTCSEEEVAEVEEEEEVEVIVMEATLDSDGSKETSESSTTSKVSTVEKSYTSNDVEFGLTVALIILVVLAILALIMVGLRKK